MVTKNRTSDSRVGALPLSPQKIYFFCELHGPLRGLTNVLQTEIINNVEIALWMTDEEKDGHLPSLKFYIQKHSHERSIGQSIRDESLF